MGKGRPQTICGRPWLSSGIWLETAKATETVEYGRVDARGNTSVVTAVLLLRDLGQSVPARAFHPSSSGGFLAAFHETASGGSSVDRHLVKPLFWLGSGLIGPRSYSGLKPGLEPVIEAGIETVPPASAGRLAFAGTDNYCVASGRTFVAKPSSSSPATLYQTASSSTDESLH